MNVYINTSDLALLQRFLSKEVVCYLFNKIEADSNKELVFLSHSIVTSVIDRLQACMIDKKFSEMSFKQRVILMNSVLDDENFCFW